jgi:prepilin-type N-terminal cleavage/methylation domain-containing protein
MRTSVFARECQRGFTLIELLVALVTTSLAMIGLISFFTVQAEHMRLENARRAAQVTARGALNFITRQLEHIGRSPNQSFTAANPAIQAALEDSLSYQANLSEEWSDTDLTDAWENVNFSYSDGVIWVSQGGDAIPLTDGSENPKSLVPDGGLIFTYYDRNGNVVAAGGDAAARASIRRINVAITVQGVVPEEYPKPEVILSQDVFLRNVS